MITMLASGWDHRHALGGILLALAALAIIAVILLPEKHGKGDDKK